MKKKKIFLTAFLAVTSIASLASCSKKKKPADPVTPTKTGEIEPTNVDETEHSVYFIVDGEIVGSVKYKEGDTQILEYAVPKKDGYKGSWDEYILSNKDIYVTARYFKENVKYRVEYYLENLENSNYTVQENETQEFTVNPNTTVTPKIKAFDHFTCENPTISETISDEGDNVIEVYYSRDRYKVDFITNNDTTIDSKTVKYGTVLDDPELTKDGYNLIGYTANGKAFTFDTPVSSDLTIEAKFQAKDNIQYKINYYQENIDDDDYSLVTEDSITTTGNTDEVITAVDKQYQGFILDENKSNMEESIQADGSTVLNVYYNRKRFTVDFVTNTSDTLEPKTVKYGQTIYCPSVGKVGYTFNGYKYDENNFFNFNNPIYSNLTLTADFTPNNVSYKINYYLENLNDNNYTLSTESINSTAKSNSKITIDKLFQGYTIDETNSDLEGIVKPDGSTVLNVYYKRKQFTVNYITNNGEEIEPQVVKYGTKLENISLSKDGYSFGCWKFNNADYDFSKGVYSDLTLEAFYIPNDSTAFKIKYYFENLDDDNYTVDENYTTTLYGKTDSETQVPLSEITGYTLTNPNQTEIIKGDGSTVVNFYYKRRVYTVSYTSEDYSDFKDKQFKFGTLLKDVLPDETLNGYTRKVYSSHYGYITENTTYYYLDDNLTLNVYFYAQSVDCKVEVYFENILDDGYTLSEEYSQTWTAETDSEISYDNTFDGFTLYSEISTASAKVKYDGSTTLKVYYKRDLYNVTFKTNDDSIVVPSQTVKYGTKLTNPNVFKVGYTLSYWRNDYSGDAWDFNNNIVSYDVELEAKWTANTIKTSIEVYYENILDDDYSLVNTDYVNTQVDTDYDLAYTTPTGFKLNENSITRAYIKADGSTVFRLYYNRYKYQITSYNFDEEGNWEQIENYEVKFGTIIKAPDVSRPGYNLIGWNYDFSNPVDANHNIYPNYEPRTNTPYQIDIYIEKVDGDGWELSKTLTEYSTTGTYFSQSSYYENNRFIENLSLYDYNDAYINGDGSTVIEMYYARPQFDIDIYYDEHVSSELGRYYYYGKELELNPEFDGNLAYDYLGIYDEDGNYLGDTFSFTVTENMILYVKTKEKEELSPFRYEASNKYLKITGFSENCDVEDLVIPDCVTEIGSSAFASNETIKTVTLGENTKVIAYRAFAYIENLTAINLNDSLEIIGGEAFVNTTLTNVNINSFPSSLKEIRYNAFYNTILDKIEFESDSNLELIGSHAFSHNTEYTTDKVYNCITIPNSVKEIDTSAFFNVIYNELHFEENSSLEFIGSSAFSNAYPFNNTVKTINQFPRSLKEIDDYAFYNIVLSNIEFESDSMLEKIGSYAFANSSDNINDKVYESITIPNSVKEIDGYAFAYLHFNNLYFEENSNLEIISNRAFTASVELESLNIDAIPNTVKEIGEYAFFDRLLSDIQFEENSSLETINQYAFAHDKMFANDNVIYETITIPSSVKSINSHAFYSIHFNNLVFEENTNIEVIESYAFATSTKENTVIPEITLPATLKTLGGYAFKNRQFGEFKVEDGIDVTLSNYALQYAYIDKLYYKEGYNSGTYGFYFAYINELIIPNTIETLVEYAFFCANIKKVTFENNSILQKIDNYAFQSSSIETITLPDTLKEIGEYAFSWCNLTSIELPNSVEKVKDSAFIANGSLSILIIGESVYEIADNAFDKSLDYIFNKSILRLAEGEADYGLITSTYIFEDEDAYKVEIKDGFIIYKASSTETRLIKYVGDETHVTIPAYVTYIENNAFYDNNNIEEVIISNHVTYIGDNAFYSCDNLYNVVIGNSVEIIDNGAFQYCSNLQTVTISDSVTTIKQYAFYECIRLSSLILGSNVTTIETQAFSDCYALVEIYNRSALDIEIGSDNNGYISYFAKRIVTSDSFESYVTFEDDFGRFDYDGESYLLYYYGQIDEDAEYRELVIPDYFTVINNFAFMYCPFNRVVLGENIKMLEEGAFYYSYDYLNDIVFNDKLEVIGDYALAQCYNLTNVVLPDSVIEIGDAAFYNNPNLCITVGSGLTTIGDSAFGESLKEFYFSGQNNIETIGESAFANCGIIEFELGENLISIGDNAFNGTYIYDIKNDSTLPISIGSSDYGQIALHCINIYNSNSGESIIKYEDGFKYVVKSENEVLLVKYNGPTGNDIDLIIPEVITSIDQNVFRGLVFKDIIITKNVVNIYSYAFAYVSCNSLTFEDGSKLEFIDDFAFKTIVFNQDELRFPSSLKELRSNNFSNPLMVKRVYFSSNLQYIGEDCFHNVTSLYRVVFDPDCTITDIYSTTFSALGYIDTLYVVIPKSVTHIYPGSIYDHNETTYYLYYGTETEWNNILIDDPCDYTLYFYSETEPETEGNYWHLDANGDPVLWNQE